MKEQRQFITAYMTHARMHAWFCGDRLMSKVVEAKDTAHPRIAVLMRSRFDHVPPTLFIVAECDPLRDDSYGLLQLRL